MRYIPIRRRSNAYTGFVEEPIEQLSIMVHEPSSEPRYTGLLNSAGDELFAVSDKRQIGFMAREGWEQ